MAEQCQASVDGYLTWPDCSAHYELLTTNTAFYSWVYNSMDSPHEPVHFWLGGQLDCATMYNRIGNLVGAEIAETLSFLAGPHRKGLFHEGVWGCTRSASVGETPYEVRIDACCVRACLIAFLGKVFATEGVLN